MGSLYYTKQQWLQVQMEQTVRIIVLLLFIGASVAMYWSRRSLLSELERTPNSIHAPLYKKGAKYCGYALYIFLFLAILNILNIVLPTILAIFYV